MRRASMLFFCACWVVAVASFGLRAGHPSAQPQAPAPVGPAPVRQASGQASGQALPPPSEQALVTQYCVTCHNARTLMGGLSLETLDPAAAASHSDVWEKVAMKLRAGMMPPVGMPRPDEATLQGFAASLEQRIDGQALRSPDPGHKTEVKEALAEAISDLPEREKLVVTLYYYEELTLREIGEVLGVTE